jgi:hypothetical protein
MENDPYRQWKSIADERPSSGFYVLWFNHDQKKAIAYTIGFLSEDGTTVYEVSRGCCCPKHPVQWFSHWRRFPETPDNEREALSRPAAQRTEKGTR